MSRWDLQRTPKSRQNSERLEVYVLFNIDREKHFQYCEPLNLAIPVQRLALGIVEKLSMKWLGEGYQLVTELADNMQDTTDHFDTTVYCPVIQRDKSYLYLGPRLRKYSSRIWGSREIMQSISASLAWSYITMRILHHSSRPTS